MKIVIPVSSTHPTDPAPYHPGIAVPFLSPRLQACIPPDGPLHAFMYWAVHSTHAPAEHLLGAALPMFLHLVARAGWTFEDLPDDPINFWTVLVGGSGIAKSTSLQRTQKFCRTLLKEVDHDRYIDPYLMAEGSVPGLLEALSVRFDETTGRTTGIVYLQELDKLLRNHKDHSIGSVLQMLSDGVDDYSRNLREYHRMTRAGEKAPSTVRNPHLNAVFCSTDAALESVFDATLMSQGLFSRLWWFKAPWNIDRLRFEKPRVPELFQAAQQVAIGWFNSITSGAEVLKQPKVVTLGTDAQEELLKFFDLCKNLMRVDSRLNSSLLRAVEKAKLLTGLLALTQHTTVATRADAARGVAIAQLCLNSSFELDVLLGVGQDRRVANRVYELLAKSGTDGMAKSDLYAALGCTKAQLDPALATLQDADQLTVVTVQRSGPGRKGQRCFTRQAAEKLHLTQSN